MPRRLPLIGICFLSLSASTADVSAQPVPDGDTLLLAQFDGGTDADYSQGDHRSAARIDRSRWTEGRFGRGIHLAAGDSVSFRADDGNFHPAAGAIAFWIRPDWEGTDPEKRNFLSIRLGETGYLNINKIGPTRLGVALAAGDGDQWKWRRADVDSSGWKRGEWHHLVFTWGGGRLKAFADGKPGIRGAEDATMPDVTPESITVIGGDATLDGLRISAREFTEEDAAKAMASALHPPYRRLTELPWQAEGTVGQGGSRLLGDRTIPLLLGATRYSDGFACEGNTQITFALPEDYLALEFHVGLSPASGVGVPQIARLEVWGDGRRLYGATVDSPETVLSKARIPLTGVKSLILKTTTEPMGQGRMLSVWANPMLIRDADAEVVAASWPVKPAELDMVRRQLGADDFHFEWSLKSGDFAAVRHWEDDLDPAVDPIAGGMEKILHLLVTPGEYGPASFAVYSMTGLTDVLIDVSDLSSESSVLPASCIDVRLVLRGLMRDLYTLPPHRSTVVPRFLLPHQKVDIPGRTFREYHLTAHVPDDAAAGVYRGQVRVTAGGREVDTLPMEIQVLPFRLDTAGDKGYGMYYRFPAADEDWTRVPVELADLRAHGANMLKSDLGVEYQKTDDGIQPSFDRLRRGLGLLQDQGFRGPLPVFSGADRAAALLGYDVVSDDAPAELRQRYMAVVKQAMSQLAELDREYEAFELLPTHMDEVMGHDRLPRYNRLSEAVRQIPSLRLYITLHNDPKRDVSEMMGLLDPYVDVRCYNGHCLDNYIQSGKSFDDLRAELAAAGDEAWLYHNIRGAFFPAEWMRLINGFYMWNSPLRIHTPWMYYSFHGNPFDATDGPYDRGGDFAFAVPDPADPTRMIPTRHWEAFREGVDDQRYLAKLESLIAARPDSAAAVSARQWLASLRERVTPSHQELQAITLESPLLVALAGRFDGRQYREFRREVADHILRLSSDR